MHSSNLIHYTRSIRSARRKHQQTKKKKRKKQQKNREITTTIVMVIKKTFKYLHILFLFFFYFMCALLLLLVGVFFAFIFSLHFEGFSFSTHITYNVSICQNKAVLPRVTFALVCPCHPCARLYPGI